MPTDQTGGVPPPSSTTTSTFTVLIVCTGNICRSPLAERLGRAYLDEALPEEDASCIRFASAGTQAVVGSTMHPDTELVLHGLGGDSAAFWAQQLDADLAAGADLTLTMTREQRRIVLELAPRGLARTFTLLEAADLLATVGDAEIQGDEVAEQARNLVRALAGARGGRRSTAADDIPDPVRRPLRVHQAVGEQIADALLPLLERLAAFVKRSASTAAESPAPPPG